MALFGDGNPTESTSFSNSSLDQRKVLLRLPDPDDVQRAVPDRAVMAQLAEGPGAIADSLPAH